MDIVAMTAAVAAGTQILKEFLKNALGITLTKAVNVTLSILLSAGVVAYYAINSGAVFDMVLVGVFIQVVLYSNGAYKIITAKRPS